LPDNGRILVVDDDDQLRVVLAEALVDEGYDVITATNGREALDYVRQHARLLNLVVLDLMMPIMDGPTFLRECGDLLWWSGVPVVVLSAAHRVQNLAVDLGPNVRAALAKPFDLAVVLALIARLTSQSTS
jgi:two-component system chemotaxis response regulator CheY